MSGTAPALKRGESADRGAVFHEIALLKARGCKGEIISYHRALRRFSFTRKDLTASAGLAVAMTWTWLLVMPLVCAAWRFVFAVWLRWLGLPGETAVQSYPLPLRLSFSVPYMRVNAGPATPKMILMVGSICGVALLASFIISRRFTAVRYVIRTLAVVQTSALVFYSYNSNHVPLPDYTYTFVASGLTMISVIPLLLGLTYYIFDVGVWRKIVLTLLVMGHLAIFIPLQVLAHAVLIHASVLFMPLLYSFFGIFLDVFIFIAFYSWGMSWDLD